MWRETARGGVSILLNVGAAVLPLTPALALAPVVEPRFLHWYPHGEKTVARGSW